MRSVGCRESKVYCINSTCSSARNQCNHCVRSPDPALAHRLIDSAIKQLPRSATVTESNSGRDSSCLARGYPLPARCLPPRLSSSLRGLRNACGLEFSLLLPHRRQIPPEIGVSLWGLLAFAERHGHARILPSGLVALAPVLGLGPQSGVIQARIPLDKVGKRVSRIEFSNTTTFQKTAFHQQKQE